MPNEADQYKIQDSNQRHAKQLNIFYVVAVVLISICVYIIIIVAKSIKVKVKILGRVNNRFIILNAYI